MIIATIVSTLVIVAAINLFCRKFNGNPKRDQHDQGVWTVARARSSPSVKPTTTTYTVTSALCSVPEEVLKTCMAAAAPRMATGDVEPVPPRVPDHPVFDDKDGGKPDPEVLSQGEGLQQKPNRGMPPVPAVESLQASAFNSNLASLDTAKYKWLVQSVVGFQAMAKGMLLRRSLSHLLHQRHAAASLIQAWWRRTQSRRMSATGDALFSKYESMLDAPIYRIYQSEESEVTWSADETDMLIERSDDSGAESEMTPHPSPKQRTDQESRLMFGDLMGVTGHSSPIKFADLMETMREPQGIVKIAEGTHCDLFRVHSREGTSVLKVVNLEFIVKYWDTLYAEAVISLELAKLRKSGDYHTTGFSDTKGIFCVMDRYPRELIQAWKDYTSWKRTDHQHGPDTLDTAQPYLVFRFAYAGVPLTQAKLDNALQLRSILQQVALSLAVAEAALQFEHRDLSLNHVLVDETSFQLYQFCMGGKNVFINSWGVRATIIDFAAARIRNASTGHIVFSNLNQSHPCESRHSNVYSIYKEIGIITKGNWAGYYPRTNVACLAHLTNQLYQAYQSKFHKLGDRKEAEAWNEIHTWRLALPEYRSVSDFVAAKF
ncbi:uncharacterized protein LOC142771607 [Rhipicephalus microplus]|uniref:uncharacterized protein LOC142771607 n=1 Tax=Rhipicephalus microplus TaxID=6941 RepID=UPI003F6A5697